MDADEKHPREEIERVRDAHPIEEVVGRYVALRRAGRRFVGFCSFHDDRRTPSLVVFPESGRWWCFGACNGGGDVFDFVMRAEGVPFPEAAEVYHAALLSNPKALAYATSRGLDADTVGEFRLGYAAGRLERYLAFRGWSEELAADLGLVDSHGREWYRGRLVIPEVRAGRSIYLVGRTVPGVRGAFGQVPDAGRGAQAAVWAGEGERSLRGVCGGGADRLPAAVAVGLPGGGDAGQPHQAGARRVPARIFPRVSGAPPRRRRAADVARLQGRLR